VSLWDRAVALSNWVGDRILRVVNRLIARSSILPEQPFYDPAQFPWVHELEANWKVIRRELDDVLAYHDDLPNFQDISTDQLHLTDDDRWKTFFFYGYGFKAGKNVERCPRTAQLVESIPGMKTAMFSILSPHKHIPAHGGPYKGVLRYHLALKVPGPPGACRIRVGDEIREWEEGKSLGFDDVFEHEAWNDSDGTRVVLFVDFVRPLRPPASWLNEVMIKAIGISPFVLDARARHNDWEKRFERLRNRAA
jgi:beta-hydroxylase